MDNDKIQKQAKQIVDKNPKLRALKSISNGEKPLHGATHGGKGSSRRTGDEQAYKSNYDQIDWSKKAEEKPTFRIKINGKYQDE